MALPRGYVRPRGHEGADLGLLHPAHQGVAPGSNAAVGCLLAAAITVCSPGCAAPDQATIVAIQGCDIAPDIFGLRVQTRGDFPPGSAERAVVTEGTALVGRDIGEVAGVTVEGLVGDDFVGAVGRSNRLKRTGEIPVYYAGIDSLCDVVSEDFVVARAPGAMAVAPGGDILIVGGLDGQGALTDEIVHLTDDENVPRIADRQVPAAVGQTLHATGDRSFLLIGGAGEGPQAHAGGIQIDVEDDARVRVSPIELHEDGLPQPRAFHAAARWNDRILVTGGCAAVQAGRCLPQAGSVLRSAVLVDVSSDPPRVLPGPTLSAARYDHQVHVARDEVLFVVGGRGVGDQPNVGIERLLPGGAWEPYGPPLVDELPDDVGIDGSVLLEGGLLILSLSDGRLLWMSEDETGQLAQWCRYGPAGSSTEPPRRELDEERQMEAKGGLIPIPPCFIGQELRPPVPRLMLALRGERILAENYIVPMASPGLSVEDVIDASQVGSRTGGLAALLADGSVIVAGGYAPRTMGPDEQEPGPPVPLRPLVRRLRPPLDGPDERIPSLSDITGSFIAVRPDRIAATGDSLEIRPLEASSFPTARARVRGFRSRNFRFEVTLSMSASDVTPYIILEQGAVAGVSVRLGTDSVRGVARAAWDSEVPFDCGPTPQDYWVEDEPRTLQVDVRPGSLVISDGDQLLARCPIQDLDVPVTIGVGAAGFSGTLTARSFRLSRL